MSVIQVGLALKNMHQNIPTDFYGALMNFETLTYLLRKFCNTLSDD